MFYFTHLRRFPAAKTSVFVWHGKTCAQKKVTIFWNLIHFNIRFKKLNILNWLTYMTIKMQLHTSAVLSLPLLNDFIFSICANYFKSISANPNHIRFNRISFNNLKRSSRATNTCCLLPIDCLYAEAFKKLFSNILWYILIMEIFIWSEHGHFVIINHVIG